jgi:transcriptional regulator with XRE-family HTH domain
VAIKPSEISSRAELRQALAELRAASGLSYEQMAAAAKIATATAYSTLNGPSFPRWGTLKAVLTTFGVGDPRELAQWRQAHRRAEKEGTDDSAGWSGPGTAIRVAECDGLSLGVHRAIAEPGIDPDSLPPYVPRDDDDSGEGVRATVEAMAHDGGFLVVVGDSSVGKTRTLYEAVRASLPSWWLVQPDSADEIRELVDAVAGDARLVVWLDELQRFLGGERGLNAATVRHLLRGPGRVLLVGTLWPVYHSAYVARPTGTEADPYPTERAVLELARVLRLGDFSDAERRRAAELAADDPRIRRALNTADHGFTQTMAAGPQLIARWQSADPYAKAFINAALDAARLGMWHPLPAALLRRAAPGYCATVPARTRPADGSRPR